MAEQRASERHTTGTRLSSRTRPATAYSSPAWRDLRATASAPKGRRRPTPPTRSARRWTSTWPVVLPLGAPQSARPGTTYLPPAGSLALVRPRTTCPHVPERPLLVPPAADSTSHPLATPAVDTVLDYPAGVYPRAGRCRVRVFRAAEAPDHKVVLATDLGDANPGPSVTNAAETIATAVHRRYVLEPACTLVVEHYDGRVPGTAARDRRAGLRPRGVHRHDRSRWGRAPRRPTVAAAAKSRRRGARGRPAAIS